MRRTVIPALFVSTVATALLVSACASDDGAKAKDTTSTGAGSDTEDVKSSGAKTGLHLDGEALALERVYADPPLAGRPPMGSKFSPDGKRLAFLKPNETDSEIADLWAVELPDGEPRPLVRTSDLIKPEDLKLSEEEKMALERRRVRHRGITSWMWCGTESRALLFPLSGDLYLVTIEDQDGETTTKVDRLTTDGKPKLDPRCAKTGEQVGYVQGGELFVLDVKKKKARKLTKGATDTRRFATAEFVAQEEMGRYTGYWLSSDGKRVAYTEVDESPVSVKTRPLIHAEKTEMYEQRYPAAGEDNAKVFVHVRDIGGARSVKLKLPAEDGYIVRVAWLDAETVSVQWQSRDQKKIVLYAGKAPRFELEELLTETDDAWVEIDDDLITVEEGAAFLWTSERTGSNQIWLYKREGGEPVQLTKDPEPVTSIVAVDGEQGRVFYLRAHDRGRQQQLFSVALKGGAPFRVTQEDGWHSVSGPRRLSKTSALVDSWSRFGVPPQVRLVAPDGEVKRVLDDNPAKELATYAAPTPEWVDVKAEDGSVLNGMVVKPLVMHGAKAPVIVYTYGGPGVNLVADRWSRMWPLFIHWSQQGFGVFVVDNRGSAHRDRAFTRAHKDAFGVVEIDDQKRGVSEVLHKLSWVDKDRIGIFGWSYGGYVTTMAMVDDETPFRAGAAVAPVTDWRLYDTHYTERFVGKPQDNEKVYTRSNAVPRAANLLKGERALLLVHGMADDNVLFQHSLALVAALQKESAPFELMVYPGAAHGIRGRHNQLHVFRTITRFFQRELMR